jgi:predicted porin
LFNKKMILVLVLLTALASVANAGDYKVYGKLHTSIDMLNNSEDSQMFLSSNTSRFGVKGAQELNENFSFIWQFEQKLNIAQFGTETLANRNSFIGVNGNWGTFLVGIHDTPYKMLGRKLTFFFDELGDFRTVTMGWDRRLQDVAAYVSPNFNGFSFVGAYQFDQGDKYTGGDNYEAQSAFSANAMYAKDALLIGAAMEQLSKGYAFDAGTDTYGESQMGMRFGGKYTMDKFAIALMYQSLSDKGGVADLKASTMGGEVKFQFDPKFAAKGSYYMADPDTDTDDDDYAQLAIGLDHTYAKNLSFYVQYAMVTNGDASSAKLAGGWHGCSVSPSAAGETASGFSVGSWFKF